MPCNANEPKTPRFETGWLAAKRKHSLPKRNTSRQRVTQRNQTREQHSKQNLTLELSGGEAVRLERVVRAQRSAKRNHSDQKLSRLHSARHTRLGRLHHGICDTTDRWDRR